jgi:hypothetical protein
MNKYLKIGIIATALVVGVLLIRKKIKIDDKSTNDKDADFENLAKRIEEAKK